MSMRTVQKKVTRKHTRDLAVQAMADAIEREMFWFSVWAACEHKRLSYEAAAGRALRALRRFARVEMRELPKHKGTKRGQR